MPITQKNTYNEWLHGGVHI